MMPISYPHEPSTNIITFKIIIIIIINNIFFCKGVPVPEAEGDEPEFDKHTMQFYVNGSNVNKLESSVVCPAWLIPPTDLAAPILKVSFDDEHNLEYRGKTIKYYIPCLVMPQTTDDANNTPVLLKIINGEAYAHLMRSHLYWPHNACSGVVC